jgi:outer membrane protein TolC
MNIWYKFWSAMVLILGCNFITMAQAITLTIEDLFNQVENANREVQLARKDVVISSMRQQAEKDSRLPDIGVSLEGNYLGNAFVLDRDFSNATRSKMTHWGNSLAISVYQPVYTGGALTAKLRLAEAQTSIAQNDVDLIEKQMKMLILQSYLELFKCNNLLNVYDENIRLTGELIDEMRARATQGLVLANDVTRYDLNLSNLKYDRLTVLNSIKNLNYSLVSYLRLNDCDSIVPTIDFDRINFSAAPLSDWMALSRQKSPTLKKFDLQQNECAANENIIKSEKLPKIGLMPQHR